MDYYTESISEKNFNSFLEVFEASFELNADENYFRNKFNTSYANSNVIGLLAFEKESKDPAAFYGVYPTIVSISGKMYVAAQSGDTATHPNHRKKGLFKWLHDLTMEQCKKDNISFIFGFPNSSSYPGFKKFGWSDSTLVRKVTRTNKVNFFSRACRKIFPSLFYKFRNMYIKNHTLTINNFNKDNKVNSLILTDRTKIIIPRTYEYLKYKTQLGSILLKINNTIAWISIKGNKIEIGDIFGNDFENGIKNLILFGERFGYNSISLKIPDIEIRKILIRDYGFSDSDAHPLIINCLNKEIADEDFHFTGGDFDFF